MKSACKKRRKPKKSLQNREKKRYKTELSKAHRGYEGKLERRSMSENSSGSDSKKSDMSEGG